MIKINRDRTSSNVKLFHRARVRENGLTMIFQANANRVQSVHAGYGDPSGHVDAMPGHLTECSLRIGIKGERKYYRAWL